MVSGSCAWTSIAKPKSVGRLPLTSCQESPASSLRITSQCFCMKSTPGREGCMRDAVHAVADLGVGSGMCSDRRPRLMGFQVCAAVVGAEGARGRDGDEDPRRDRCGSRRMVCRHIPPAPGCQRGPGAVAAQSGEFLPGLAAVGRAEQRGVFHPGIDGIGIGQRRLEMPDALELPGMRRAVVPLVSAGDAVVDELVAHRLPGLAAVVER